MKKTNVVFLYHKWLSRECLLLKLFGRVITLIGVILTLNFIAWAGLLLIAIRNFITKIPPVSILQRVTINSANSIYVGLQRHKKFQYHS
jgi:hypothetical protein